MKETEKTNCCYQQGDVLIKQRSRIPTGVKKLTPKARGWVFAEGEHTGHAHCVADVEALEMYEDSDGTIWVRVREEARLTHEEHNAQTIAPGVYEIGIVREIDPFSEEIREVMD